MVEAKFAGKRPLRIHLTPAANAIKLGRAYPHLYLRFGCRRLARAKIDGMDNNATGNCIWLDWCDYYGPYAIHVIYATGAARHHPLLAGAWHPRFGLGNCTCYPSRIGVPAWIIDLVTSALGSVAANGLACCLLIFGSHSSHRRERTQAQVFTPVPRELVVPSAPPKPKLVASDTVPAGSVDAWVTDHIQAVHGAMLPFRDAYLDYKAWCEHSAVPSLAPDDFANRLAKLCEGTDVYAKTAKDGVVYLVNVRLTGGQGTSLLITLPKTTSRRHLGPLAAKSSA